jgi:Fe-S oxidoreductase
MESLDAPTSRSVAQARVEQAIAAGADLLVTACPQCVRTLAGARSRENRIPVVDLVELAWRSVAAA